MNFEDSMILDKMPQAIEIEKALLGTALTDENAAVRIIDELSINELYIDKHKYIYQSINDLFEKGTTVDMLTVSDDLRNKQKIEAIGGVYYLTEVTAEALISSSQLTHYILIVKQKHLQRELITLSQRNIQAAKSEADIFDVYDQSLEQHGRILDGQTQDKNINIKQVVTQVYEDILNGKKTKGLTTGINAIDQNFYGLRSKKLYIVAARPGMGKTALALQLALNVAGQNHSVGIISLEMDSDEITRRMVSNLSQTELSQVELNEVQPAKLDDVTKAVDEIALMPIHFKEMASNLIRIRATAKRWKIQKNLKCLIIDYLQLMDGSKDGNREQEISSISRGLKRLAMELDIPVICLSQLSRNVENRGGLKIPMLSDLRESGAIEQDADGVVFLWRPEYYDMEEVPQGMFVPEPQGVKNFLGLRIAKNRGGRIGDFSCKFFGATQKITNLQSIGQSPTNEPVKDLPF